MEQNDTNDTLEDSESTATEARSPWRQLFDGRHFVPMTIAAGGVLLYAMNIYFTAALMPSVVSALGGQKYFAWAATSYLIAAVVATMLAGRLLAVVGIGRAYVLATVIFGSGTAVCAATGSVELFVVGRGVQGFGAGLLAALGYATIRSRPSRSRC